MSSTQSVTVSVHRILLCNIPDEDCLKIQSVPLATEPGWLADRCSMSQQLGALHTHTHYRHIPLHFSHNERTPVQISLQYLHWC
jgi:hypothetical protein